MPSPFHPHSTRDPNRNSENGHKKRKHASDPGPNRSKRSCSDNTQDAFRNLTERMERENSRNDFSFLALIEQQQRDQYLNDTAPTYNAITRYMEEPMKYEHRRTCVEQDTSFADPLDRCFFLDGQQQRRHWRAPEVDGMLAGGGIWADESSTRKESEQIFSGKDRRSDAGYRFIVENPAGDIVYAFDIP
ncbi:MAG: hypothetical protein Q9166_004777 [cf. Caloplaca sp. 2 TL-2023]